MFNNNTYDLNYKETVKHLQRHMVKSGHVETILTYIIWNQTKKTTQKHQK